MTILSMTIEEIRTLLQLELKPIKENMATKADLAKLEETTKSEIARLEEKILPKEELEQYLSALKVTIDDIQGKANRIASIDNGIDRLLDLAEARTEDWKDLKRRVEVLEAKVFHKKLLAIEFQAA